MKYSAVELAQIIVTCQRERRECRQRRCQNCRGHKAGFGGENLTPAGVENRYQPILVKPVRIIHLLRELKPELLDRINNLSDHAAKLK